MDLLGAFIPFLVMFGLMYFMIIRPQKRQQQTKQNMLQQMGHGDHVVTIGGLHGVVDEVNHNNGTVVIDCEGVYLTFEISAIGKVEQGNASQIVESKDDIAHHSEVVDDIDDVDDVIIEEPEDNF